MDVLVNTDAASMSPIGLFMQADWVVKFVMLGLLAASIWTWAIILTFLGRLRRVRRDTEAFVEEFERTEDIDAFHKKHVTGKSAVAQVFAAGVREWRRSTASTTIDRDGTRERLATSMGSAVAEEVDKLSDRLNVLATIGSVAPFVGLFGTCGASCAASPASPRRRTPASRWWHRVSPRRCSRPRSACSRPFRR